MSMQFADRQDAIKYLGEKLSRALPSDLGLGNEIASSLVEVFLVQAEAGTTSDRRAVFAPARWVIRDQDLDLLGNVGSILSGNRNPLAYWCMRHMLLEPASRHRLC